MSTVEQWIRATYTCPKCQSKNTKKLDLYKQAYDLKKGIRRVHRKYICNDCGNEFWKQR